MSQQVDVVTLNSAAGRVLDACLSAPVGWIAVCILLSTLAGCGTDKLEPAEELTTPNV